MGTTRPLIMRNGELTWTNLLWVFERQISVAKDLREARDR